MINNQLSYEEIKSNLILKIENETKALDIADQMFSKCGKIIDTDRCEAAGKIYTCVYDLFHLC